jgi:hypothetical protein
VIANGAFQVQLLAGPANQGEAVAATSGQVPFSYSILAGGGPSYTLRFSAGRTGAVRWTVRLSPRWRWDVVVRGGTTHLILDLSALQLQSLNLGGGAYTMVIDLPRPRGVIPVDVTGGANQMTFRVPPATDATLTVGPGVSRVQGGTAIAAGRYSFGGGGPSGDEYLIKVSSGAALVVLSTT